jgi:hypothetical protein
VLLAGVPPEWFYAKEGMAVEGLCTHFGKCTFRYAPTDRGATLTLSGDAAPPSGFVLCLPASVSATASAGGKPLPRAANGDVAIPPSTRHVEIVLSLRP